MFVFILPLCSKRRFTAPDAIPGTDGKPTCHTDKNPSLQLYPSPLMPRQIWHNRQQQPSCSRSSATPAVPDIRFSLQVLQMILYTIS